MGYVWACGIRNGDGGGRSVPLKAGIGLPVMTPYFEATELGSIGMGAESSPFPLASHLPHCVNHCSSELVYIVSRLSRCK